MKLVKKIIKIVMVVAMVIGLGSCTKSCWDYTTYKETFEYNLYEMNDGIYAYYNIVSSSKPAYNYEVITLYFADGVYTLKGDVNIHYTDSKPRIVWEKTNVVNGDTIDVYIPYNSLEVRPNMTVG